MIQKKFHPIKKQKASQIVKLFHHWVFRIKIEVYHKI